MKYLGKPRLRVLMWPFFAVALFTFPVLWVLTIGAFKAQQALLDFDDWLSEPQREGDGQ